MTRVITRTDNEETAILRNDDHTRGAMVYLTCNTEPRVWRIRAEKFPENTRAGSGWFGGNVLWGHDKPTRSEAIGLAMEWVLFGRLPEVAR